MSNYYTVKFTNAINNLSISGFDCGNPALTSFLKSPEAVDDMFGKTYVMISHQNKIIGYYNISTGDISNPNHIRTGGSVYINCLAVDKVFQKQKYNQSKFYISDWLLADCIHRIRDLRNNHLGFAFITLSSTQEGKRLYERNGFFEVEDDMLISKNPGEKTCTPMYFPLDYE